MTPVNCDIRVNPSDPQAVDAMIRWRQQLLRPLTRMDGLVIIDSDPGGYPGSTNEEFVALLGAHRTLLDKLRPGIELFYWSHVGWAAYCEFYNTDKFRMGTQAELLDAYASLQKLNPEPWGLANGLYADEAGLSDRVISYQYGRIEGEPSFPATNFGGQSAYEGGAAKGARGVMGNAQTHCVQLPNIFAFSRGALGKSLDDSDYDAFAEDLLPSNGKAIHEAWRTLAGKDPTHMRSIATQLEEMAAQPLKTGPLRGLLFGDPQRFVLDLVYQLRLSAARIDLVEAYIRDRFGVVFGVI